MSGLSPHHQSYLRGETLVSTIINAALSLVAALAVWHGRPSIPPWGSTGYAVDFLPQLFMITFATTLAVTLLARKRLRDGKITPLGLDQAGPLAKAPRTAILRAGLFGLTAALVVGPVTIGIATLAGVGEISGPVFVTAKVLYGALVSMLLVGPVARAALADPGRKSPMGAPSQTTKSSVTGVSIPHVPAVSPPPSDDQSMSKGRVAIIGAGPAGLAAALGLSKVGYEVALFERYGEIKAAGNILNLWPSPQKALKELGVDIEDLGAPSFTELRRYDGRLRAKFNIKPEVVAEFNGGFIGLIRWGLYKRLLDTLPQGVLRLSHELTGFEDKGSKVRLSFRGRPDYEADILIGADGINSMVRKELWGDSPKRPHRLHLFGGYLFLPDDEVETLGVFSHNGTVQGSWTPIRHEGRSGYEWWVLEAWEAGKPFTQDLRQYAAERTRDFAHPLPDFIARTSDEHTHRWEIVDRLPIKQWSKGRVTLIGDAAHPTSPYAAYGAGMSVEDGYFLARALNAVDATSLVSVREGLQAFEDGRRDHCTSVSQEAYISGQLFHHCPAFLRPLRDWVFDHTQFLQIMQATPLANRACELLKEITPLTRAPRDGEQLSPVTGDPQLKARAS